MLQHGNVVGKSASSGSIWCSNADWRQLVSSGTTPYKGRQWMKIQAKGQTALALKFVNRNADGTFTAPVGGVNADIIIPANTVEVFNLGDTVSVYGRAVAKAGATATGCRVPVIEFK